MKEKPLFVTQPSLPPLEEYIPYLEKIWGSRQLTNKGPFHEQLEGELADFLGVKYLSLFANGTVALMAALKTMGVSGEVITTPYSFVATSHALLWNDITPIFVDVESAGCNLDPEQIEAAITSKTSAILPVHCYGTPCNTSRIREIADSYQLPVIYDAAHAFGVESNGRSLLLEGDLSVLSFHATKVFHTFEGGAVVSHSKVQKQQLDYLRNFGFENEVSVVSEGINGKMSELNASFGLLQLNYVESNLQRRRTIDAFYRERMSIFKGLDLLPVSEKVKTNYSYFPIFVNPDFPLSRDELYDLLKSNGVFARRYFYPLISAFSMYRDYINEPGIQLPNALKMSAQVICLPLSSEISIGEAKRVVDVIESVY